MDRPDQAKQYNTMAARERSAQVLRNRARQYHEYAVSLEKLADWATGLNDEQDEALWRVVEGYTPR